MGLVLLIRDLFLFPFQSAETRKAHNKLTYVLNFLLRDYPAYLWQKFSIWRLLLFPFLLVHAIFSRKVGKLPGQE